MIPSYSQDDLLNAWINGLKPDWLSLPADSDSTFYKLMSGLLATHYGVTTTAESLPVNSFPATLSADMLADWQASLGLPDPLIQVTGLQNEINQVVARLTADGGASIPYFQNFIGNLLGIIPALILITEYFPFLMEVGLMGFDPVAGDGSQFYWTISIPSAQAAHVGLVHAEVARIAPAYTIFNVITY